MSDYILESEEENIAPYFESIDDDLSDKPVKPLVECSEFIEALKSNEELCERFEHLDCVNVFLGTDGKEGKEGCTSVVFKANDATDDRKLAVKVLDKSSLPGRKCDSLIEWESKLLELLKNKKNCQVLRVPHRPLNVDVNGKLIPTSYLATIYLKTDIRRFFYKGDKSIITDLSKKLKVYISVLSAIKVLHSMDICHRDIKPENFRACKKDGKSVVVAIDLGLALASQELEHKIRMFSPEATGNQEYAAPEKLCGFENDYALGKGADMYSLGCLLYELVGKDLFYEQFKALNKNCYCRIMNDCKVYNSDGDSLEERLSVYDSYIDRDFSQLQLPQLPQTLGIPEHARKEIQGLIDGLCCLDYRKRIKSSEIESVKNKIRSIIGELEDRRRYERKGRGKEAV